MCACVLGRLGRVYGFVFVREKFLRPWCRLSGASTFLSPHIQTTVSQLSPELRAEQQSDSRVSLTVGGGSALPSAF